MPRHSIGARLYVRRRKGRPSIYVIRDGSREISTGICVGEPEAKTRAEEGLQAHLAVSHKADFGNGDPRRVLVSDVLDLYGREKAPKNQRPDVDDSAIFHLLMFFVTDRVADVTPERATAYVTWRTAMPQARFKDPASAPRVGQATARRELEVLSAAIGYAHKEHKLTHTIVVKLPEKGQARDRWLTRDEAARLVWAAYRGVPEPKRDDEAASADGRKKKKRPQPQRLKHLARFILIALYTGTRHEAVLRLKWLRSVDSGSVDLSSGLIYRRGSRESDSNKRRPPVPISARLGGHLQRWHRQSAACGEAYVITYEGEPCLRLRRSWNTARIAAKLGPDVVPHVLRHTFATWAVQNGHSFAKVAAALGTSERMIEQTYGHHCPDHLRDVVDFTRRSWGETGAKLKRKTSFGV